MEFLERVQNDAETRVNELADQYVEWLKPIIEKAAKDGHKCITDKMFKPNEENQPKEHKVLFKHPDGVEKIKERLPGFEVYIEERSRMIFNVTLSPVKHLVVKW